MQFVCVINYFDLFYPLLLKNINNINIFIILLKNGNNIGIF